jgi:hypothetical protein
MPICNYVRMWPARRLSPGTKRERIGRVSIVSVWKRGFFLFSSILVGLEQTVSDTPHHTLADVVKWVTLTSHFFDCASPFRLAFTVSFAGECVTSPSVCNLVLNQMNATIAVW